jgi:hypothetical protein
MREVEELSNEELIMEYIKIERNLPYSNLSRISYGVLFAELFDRELMIPTYMIFCAMYPDHRFHSSSAFFNARVVEG